MDRPAYEINALEKEKISNNVTWKNGDKMIQIESCIVPNERLTEDDSGN